MTTQLRKIKDAEYFAIRDRFHASDAGKLLVSPAYYKHCLDNPRKTTDDMIKGKIIHAMMGDPDELRLYPTEVPGLAGLCDDKGKPYADPAKSNAGKAIVAAWKAANPDANVVTQETLDACRKMADALTRREATLGGTVLHREVAILWDDADDLPCILKADAIIDCGDRLIVLDYKKHGKLLTNRSIRNSIIDFGYHRAAAHYLDGVEAAQRAGLLPVKPVVYMLAWVSAVAPYETHLQAVGDDFLVAGAYDLAEAKTRWSLGHGTGQWLEASDLGDLETIAQAPAFMRNDTDDVAGELGLEGIDDE